ncbi:MAG: TetR/AcrR family transcriptional regulator [Cellvibrionaceae bacterium]
MSNSHTLSKGEKTRLSILRATLRVIAHAGRVGVTHRAVAKEAGVSLSLTTYYFKDLSELLIEAFRLHKHELHEQLAPRLEANQAEVDVLLECRRRGDQEGERQAIDSIADQLTDFVLLQLQDGRQGLMVEMSFFFDMHMPESFRRVAYELRQRFVDDLATLCQSLGSTDANADAEIIIGVIQRLQYEALAVPDYTGVEKARRHLKRVLQALWYRPPTA